MKTAILIISAALAMAGCCSGDKNKKDLLQKLKATTEKGFMFGHHDDPVYGHTWYLDSNRSDVKEVTGDMPALLSFDIGRIEFSTSPKDSNLDKVPFARMRREIIHHHEKGGLVTLSWHVANPITDGGSWDVGDSSVQTVLPQGSNHKKFIQWIDNVADFVNSIKTKDGKKIPIIFRPYHENTGFWFWWGAKHCTVEQYKELWRMTVNRLKEKGATQLIYAYSPQELKDTTHYLERYPGDDIIDIIGTDLYQFNDSIYQSVLPQQLEIITTIAKTHNKVAALTETGLEGIPDSTWWTEKLLPIVAEYPIAYLLVWRNACDRPTHYYAPFKGQVSASNFVQFYNHPRTLFLKNL
ncbi:MAG: beta-mannosidase [Bacteroidales bacterium]|jgi:mannan endo-1,4-beta-mannosidase|nr:beta-mannosidase [Bacteroidales bacterium]